MANHPHLLTTRKGIERARRLIESEQWARAVRDRLVEDAQALGDQPLPVFETAWWETARQKRWMDTYPEIHHHCNKVPLPLIHAAYHGAMAYALTDDDRIAEEVLRVLRHYTGYSFEFEHPDVGMVYGIWGLMALHAYDLVYDRVPEADRPQLDAFFARMLAAVMRNDKWWVEENPGGLFSNHCAWHKLLVGGQGLFYDRQDLIDYALDGEQGFLALVEHGLMDDGLWFESSTHYHVVGVLPLVLMAEMLRNSGHPFDLWNHRFANGRTPHDFFRAPLELAFPDLALPTIGDCYGQPVRPTAWQLYEHAQGAGYRDPAFAWVVSRRTDDPKRPHPERLFLEPPADGGAPPTVFSRVFPEHGYVMLRSVEGSEYWDGDGWAAFLSYDRDGFHSNHDKLSLILFGRRVVLAPDCEARPSAWHPFSAKAQRELNRATLCHNTVMVDGREHASVAERLSLIEFKPLPTVKTATIGDLRGLVCPGVRMQRTVAVTDDYVLDVFQVASDAEHTYDWLFHANADDGVTRTAGELAPIALPEGPPWSWLRNARSRVEDGTWPAEWTIGDVTLRLTMLGEPGTEIMLWDFPRDDQYHRPPYAVVTARRRGTHAIFVALYQAQRGDVPSASLSTRSDAYGGFRITVEIAGKAVDQLVPLL